VAVGVEGYGDAVVPEALLHVLRMYALYEQQGRAGVPEIVSTQYEAR
jgi:hypothetical protein